MTTKQLIEELQKYPEDMPVMKCGYEGGYVDIATPVEKENILLNVNTDWWYGPHGNGSQVSNKIGLVPVKALIL